MILYLIRHAKALDRSDWSGPDSERPLTDKGRKIMRQVARRLESDFPVRLDAILSSPYTRAHDTAKLLAKAFGMKQNLSLAEELTPSGDLRLFLSRTLAAYPPKSHVAIVGHEPALSRLAGMLLRQPGRLPLDFKKSGLCRIDVDGKPGVGAALLSWFLPPKLIQR